MSWTIASRASHPRPQLLRQRWTDLSGPWGFAFDDHDRGRDERWCTSAEPFTSTIVVPFPPESKASGIGDRGFHPVVWYRRTFRPTQDEGERLLLHFGAVDHSADVWVNGHHVVHHDGGHTPFEADITTSLDDTLDEQVIVVRAEDQPGDLTQPRGKQDWKLDPHRIWYHRTTGIWQPVWLEPVPDLHIVDIRWTPDLGRAVLGMHVRLNRAPSAPARIRLHLRLGEELVADDVYVVTGGELRREIALDPGELTMERDRWLWSPRTPNLLDACVTLHDGDRHSDEVSSYAGLRSTAVRDGRFVLNGRAHYLRLALSQNYWPDSHLAAPDADALRREVEVAKELGFNGIRIHQKVEDPRFLYWCDRLGLLVWGEMANAYAFDQRAVERLTSEWMQVLARDYSHPCIVTWVPFNESWGVPALEQDEAQQSYVRAIYHLTKALDPTRPVIGNDGWEHVASDIWGIHDYALDGSVIRARYGTPDAVESTLRQVQPHYRTLVLGDGHHEGEPIVLTECGGLAFAPKHASAWLGYGAVDDADAFLARYEDLVGAILACPTIAGFCYTQLTDTEQETNGLLWPDRTPKVDPRALHAITSRHAEAVAGDVIGALQVEPFTPAPPES